jgi:hypothetical protein
MPRNEPAALLYKSLAVTLIVRSRTMYCNQQSKVVGKMMQSSNGSVKGEGAVSNERFKAADE